ncbi:MAG: hypothetical protein DRN47_04870, partial [Candidatus Wolframiiraptor sp.]
LSEKTFREHVNNIRKELQKHGLHTRLLAISTSLPQYDKVLNAFNMMKSRLDRMGPLPDSLREKLRQELKD